MADLGWIVTDGIRAEDGSLLRWGDCNTPCVGYTGKASSSYLVAPNLGVMVALYKGDGSAWYNWKGV